MSDAADDDHAFATSGAYSTSLSSIRTCEYVLAVTARFRWPTEELLTLAMFVQNGMLVARDHA